MREAIISLSYIGQGTGIARIKPYIRFQYALENRFQVFPYITSPCIFNELRCKGVSAGNIPALFPWQSHKNSRIARELFSMRCQLFIAGSYPVKMLVCLTRLFEKSTEKPDPFSSSKWMPLQVIGTQDRLQSQVLHFRHSAGDSCINTIEKNHIRLQVNQQFVIQVTIGSY